MDKPRALEARHDLDQVCQSFHFDHIEMLGQWAAGELTKLPEDTRNPADGTARDLPTILSYLAGAFPWMVANDKLGKANCDYDEMAPTIAAEEAVRAAAKALIDAALGCPPPYRDVMVQRSLA